MQEMFSKAEDVNFLANELKKILGEKISINTFSLVNEVLTGKFILDGTKIARFDGIDFNIKFSKGEFLRINVGEIYILAPYEEKVEILKELVSAISLIEINGAPIGKPHAFYTIEENRIPIPYCDWAFAYKDEYLTELKENTMYEDTNIENLILFDENNNVKTLQKSKEDK